MLTNKDYCDYDTCVALKELGYNYPSNYTYVNNIRVKDEISEKHPGLSDDGYLDLIDEYGGPYKRDEIYGKYIEPLKRWSRNSLINGPYELCVCAHLYEVQKWLREEKRIDVLIYLDDMKGYYPFIRVWKSTWNMITNENLRANRVAYFSLYEEALLDGIKEAVKILKDETIHD